MFVVFSQKVGLMRKMKSLISQPIGEKDVFTLETQRLGFFQTSILEAKTCPFHAHFPKVEHEARFVALPLLDRRMIVPARSLERGFAVVAMVSCLVRIEVGDGAGTIRASPFTLFECLENLVCFFALATQTPLIQDLSG